MPHKPSHGGRRKNAGRPASTGMASTPPVHYRVSEAQHADLTNAGAERGLSANMEAKRRAFPRKALSQSQGGE